MECHQRASDKACRNARQLSPTITTYPLPRNKSGSPLTAQIEMTPSTSNIRTGVQSNAPAPCSLPAASVLQKQLSAHHQLNVSGQPSHRTHKRDNVHPSARYSPSTLLIMACTSSPPQSEQSPATHIRGSTDVTCPRARVAPNTQKDADS